jgi:hypothetical protein
MDGLLLPIQNRVIAAIAGLCKLRAIFFPFNDTLFKIGSSITLQTVSYMAILSIIY